MTTQEFSDQFDILYNNITSNQAPGLDEYEKSFFLTRAQDDIVKRYFTPKGNKDVEGFDHSVKRNVDFSMLYKVQICDADHMEGLFDIDNLRADLLVAVQNLTACDPTATMKAKFGDNYPLKNPKEAEDSNQFDDYWGMSLSNGAGGEGTQYQNPWFHISDKVLNEIFLKNSAFIKNNNWAIDSSLFSHLYVDLGYIESTKSGDSTYTPNITKTWLSENPDQQEKIVDLYLDRISQTISSRANSIIIATVDDIFLPINEQLEVTDNSAKIDRVLQVIPITSVEYIRLMSKPFKQPLKNQSWKIYSNNNTIELVFGYNNTFKKYTLRYLKHPTPIILTNLKDSGVSINGYYGGEGSENSPCKDETKATTGLTCLLNEELHSEILQRAVELAKSAYTGDLSSSIALGSNSQTNLGIIAQQRQSE